jgi:hypothetical protein
VQHVVTEEDDRFLRHFKSREPRAVSHAIPYHAYPTKCVEVRVSNPVLAELTLRKLWAHARSILHLFVISNVVDGRLSAAPRPARPARLVVVCRR